MNISVIICTHNPRPDYLRRVLDALKTQTLSKDQWELLLIDNASQEILANTWDLSWHPHARHIREEELGLTPSRLRGIREAKGGLLVFVDDDNVLAADYLEQALQVAHEWPRLGAWGCSIAPEFEQEPEGWTKQYWYYLAVRPLERDYWGNDPACLSAIPWGAGLCVRREVATFHSEQLAKDPIRRALGRKGASLISGEDADLALSSVGLGLGFGVFARLRLIHLIPAFRLSEDYLVNLAKHVALSGHLLGFALSGRCSLPEVNCLYHLSHVYKCLFLPRLEKRFYLARREADAMFARMLADLPTPGDRGPIRTSVA